MGERHDQCKSLFTQLYASHDLCIYLLMTVKDLLNQNKPNNDVYFAGKTSMYSLQSEGKSLEGVLGFGLTNDIKKKNKERSFC